MSLFKKLCFLGAICAMSLSAFAAMPDHSSGKCYPGGSCKGNKSMTTGQRPLKMQSVDNVRGTVKTMKKVQYPDGYKTHMVVETHKGDVNCILGPSNHIDQSKMSLQHGDKVQVKGHEVNGNNGSMMVVTEVHKSGSHMHLRDEKGHEVWQDNHNGRKDWQNPKHY